MKLSLSLALPFSISLARSPARLPALPYRIRTPQNNKHNAMGIIDVYVYVYITANDDEDISPQCVFMFSLILVDLFVFVFIDVDSEN